MFNEKKRVVPWATLLIAAILFTSGIGVGVLATPPASNGVWSGNWIREAYAYFTSGLQLPFLTVGRVTYAGAGGNLTDSASMTFSASKGLYAVPWMNTTNSKVSSLTAGRPVISGLGGILATDAGLTYDAATDTLTATNISTGQLTDSGLTSGRVVLAGSGGLLGDDGGFLYNAVTNTATLGNLTVTNNDILNYPYQTANYIIWKSGSTYYSKSGADGLIKYSGINATTIIQSSIDVLGGSGGTILIKRGTYTLTTQIVQKASVIIRGEGIGVTILDFSTGTSNGIVTVSGSKRWMGIFDLLIKMNNKIGINWINVSQSAIERVRILSPSIGFRLSGNDGTASASIWNNIIGIQIDNPSDAGIRLTGVNNNGESSGNYIQGGVRNLVGGAPIAGTIGFDMVVGIHNDINMQIQQVVTGIRFDDAEYNEVILHLDKITAFTTEISFTANSLKNRVTGGNIVDAKISDLGTGNIVIPNYTKSGTVATTAKVATIAVTHGLSYTPIAGDIMLTPQTSTYNVTSYAITAYSSTTFTITTYDATGAAKGASSAITFIWKAQK